MSDKICAVCGDKALSTNFGALTCEPCRQFFRRNANKIQDFVCIFKNKCVVNQKSRQFCKKCRIDKCFAIGMKKGLFCSFKEREDMVRNNDRKHKTLYGYRRKRVKIMDPIVSTTNELIPVYTREPIFVDQIPCIIRGVIFDFNQFEQGRFKQLFSFMNEIKDPVVRCTSNCTTYTDYIRITETWNELKYKQFVKMATNITEFNDLCAEDKVSLLKTGLSELMALTTVLRFDFEGEFWRVPIDNENAIKLPLNLLKCAKYGIYDECRKFMINLNQEFDSDFNLIDILTAILLFNPNVQNLMNRDIIRLQRKTYMYLLQRYLEIKHNSKSESETRFGRLMNCLQDLYVVSPLSVKNYIEFNTTAKNPGPLMKELYNV